MPQRLLQCLLLSLHHTATAGTQFHELVPSRSRSWPMRPSAQCTGSHVCVACPAQQRPLCTGRQSMGSHRPQHASQQGARPAVTKSRLLRGVRKCGKSPVDNPSVVECPWDRAAPTAAPMCTMGPSGPTGSPEATARQQDRNLTPRVRTLNTWCMARVVQQVPSSAGRGPAPHTASSMWEGRGPALHGPCTSPEQPSRGRLHAAPAQVLAGCQGGGRSPWACGSHSGRP